MTVSKSEREERRNLDDGDPSDTVYFTDSYEMSENRAYHEDKTCGKIENISLDSDTRGNCKEKDWYPCRNCTIEEKGSLSPGGLSNLEMMIQNGSVPEEHLKNYD